MVKSLLFLFFAFVLGCGSESDEISSSGPYEGDLLEGEWFGDTVSFNLNNKQLSNWFLTGLRCKEVTENDDGSTETCSREPGSGSQFMAAVDQGTFMIKLDFLVLKGTFESKGYVQGTWAFKPSDCCSSKGTWEAWHQTWYEEKKRTDGTDGDDGTSGATVLTDGADLSDGSSDGSAGSDGAIDGRAVTPGAAGEYSLAPDANSAQKAAMDRVNWYRENVGVPLMNNVGAINKASQSHADYYVTHAEAYKKNKVTGGAHSQDPNYSQGFTGKSFADRMKKAGYKGQPGWEVMAFMNDPVKAVDGWVETVYHRIPITSPDAHEGGYGGAGGAASCDVMDFGRKNHTDKQLVVVYPFPDQTNVPKKWSGNEWPKPPAPPDGYPSGPVITAQTSQGSSLKITGHEIRDSKGNSIEHVWHPQGDNQFLKFTWALYPHKPLAGASTYTVELTGTMGGKPWSRVWSFTTRK